MKDDHAAPLDKIFVECHEAHSVTTGIGDGGKDLGTGNVAEGVSSSISPGRPYACVIPSDYCICAGANNCGAYGLTILLSVLNGAALLVQPKVFPGILDEIVKAGAVDGITGKHSPTVDSLARAREDEVYRALYHIVEESLR